VHAGPKDFPFSRRPPGDAGQAAVLVRAPLHSPRGIERVRKGGEESRLKVALNSRRQEERA